MELRFKMFVFYDENLKGTYSERWLSDCSQLWEEMGANIVFFMVLFLFLLSDTTMGAWHEWRVLLLPEHKVQTL